MLLWFERVLYVMIVTVLLGTACSKQISPAPQKTSPNTQAKKASSKPPPLPDALKKAWDKKGRKQTRLESEKWQAERVKHLEQIELWIQSAEREAKGGQLAQAENLARMAMERSRGF